MNLGLVVGTATATVRHRSMAGAKLLVVQPLTADEQGPDGDPVIAMDQLGADVGHVVILTSDGAEVQRLVGDKNTPIRWSVMGLRDA